MKMDVIEEVAKANCPDCYGTGYQDEEMGGEVGYIQWDCRSCDATGLKWPTLSCECPWGAAGQHCSQSELNDPCYGSGRVSDVRLEKVMDLLSAWAKIDFHQPFDDEWMVVLPFMDNTLTFTGSTPLEAACSALLHD